MLISGSSLAGVEVLSLHLGGAIARIVESIIDPNGLKIVAFEVDGPQVGGENGNILEVKSVREFAQMGMIVDSIDELVYREDVVKLDEIMGLDFHLNGMIVETKSGKRMGKVSDYNVDVNSFQIIQLVVKRPVLKGFLDPELVISRTQIREITDDKIILKEEKDKNLKKANSKDFVPNFVNPFRQEPNFAPVRSRTPDKEDTE